jgi:putative membrane protein
LFLDREPFMKQLLAAASVVALLAAAPAWAQNAATQGTTAPESGVGTAAAAARTLSQQDQTFVSEAGAGNLAEADMGDLAVKKAATPGIREFGRWMYTDHGLIANNWLKSIMAAQNETFQPTLTSEQQQMRQKLEGLSGRQFDQQYIQHQVTDHEKTIPVFQREASEGQNPMLKNYAEAMVPVLQQHLAEAKALAGRTAVAGKASGASESTGSSSER